MDVQMPVMNGYEATKNIRHLEIDTHIPIIAFTAGNVKGERDKCLAAGMDDFVVKPVVEETVAGILKKWLDSNSGISGLNQDEKVNSADLHYNPERLKNYTYDDPQIMEDILNILKSELNGSLLSLHELLEQVDLTRLNEAGHKLYGTAISAGMPRLSKMASSLEHLEEFDSEFINMIYRDIASEINLVLKILEKEEV